MRYLAILGAVLVSAIALANPAVRTLIVGGKDADPKDFPYIVSFQSEDFSGHFCGGTLIKSHWVLTAAHCADYIPTSIVYVGLYQQSDKTTAETFKVKKVVVHPKNDASDQDFDFALVELDGDSKATPLAFNKSEITIPSDSSLISTVAGWGYTTENSGTIPDTLQKVDVPLVPEATCAAAYAQNNKVTDSMICAGYQAGGKDACQGDSGGPLMITQNGKTSLIGVVSWGQGCAEANYYGVYAKVNAASDWIQQTIDSE